MLSCQGPALQATKSSANTLTSLVPSACSIRLEVFKGLGLAVRVCRAISWAVLGQEGLFLQTGRLQQDRAVRYVHEEPTDLVGLQAAVMTP